MHLSVFLLGMQFMISSGSIFSCTWSFWVLMQSLSSKLRHVLWSHNVHLKLFFGRPKIIYNKNVFDWHLWDRFTTSSDTSSLWAWGQYNSQQLFKYFATGFLKEKKMLSKCKKIMLTWLLLIFSIFFSFCERITYVSVNYSLWSRISVIFWDQWYLWDDELFWISLNATVLVLVRSEHFEWWLTIMHQTGKFVFCNVLNFKLKFLPIICRYMAWRLWLKAFCLIKMDISDSGSKDCLVCF